MRDRLERSIGRTHGYVVLAPGGTWPSKRWAVGRFGELAGRIVAELRRPVVIAGRRAERQMAEAMVQANPGGRVVSFAGETTLSELVALIEQSAGVVCNDSGPMHMAAALHRPLTVIIGPTNPSRTGPYRRPECVVRSDWDCSPCYQRRCTRVAAGEDPPCLADVSVEAVLANLARQVPPLDQGLDGPSQ